MIQERVKNAKEGKVIMFVKMINVGILVIALFNMLEFSLFSIVCLIISTMILDQYSVKTEVKLPSVRIDDKEKVIVLIINFISVVYLFEMYQRQFQLSSTFVYLMYKVYQQLVGMKQFNKHYATEDEEVETIEPLIKQTGFNVFSVEKIQ